MICQYDAEVDASTNLTSTPSDVGQMELTELLSFGKKVNFFLDIR